MELHKRASAARKRGCYGTGQNFNPGCAHCSGVKEGWPCEDLRRFQSYRKSSGNIREVLHSKNRRSVGHAFRGREIYKVGFEGCLPTRVLEQDSRKYVTISTHMGLFQYTRLSFGMSSAPATFQREMENLFRGLPHVAVYFHDILVTGKTDSNHLRNLRSGLARLRDVGLRLRFDKCLFFLPQVEYLGHVISKEGLSPCLGKVTAVLHAPAPRNVKELQSFLSLISFFRRFLPNLSGRLHPLHSLLTDGKKWEWGIRQEDAFTSSSHLLTSAPVLAHLTQRSLCALVPMPHRTGSAQSWHTGKPMVKNVPSPSNPEA